MFVVELINSSRLISLKVEGLLEDEDEEEFVVLVVLGTELDLPTKKSTGKEQVEEFAATGVKEVCDKRDLTLLAEFVFVFAAG